MSPHEIAPDDVVRSHEEGALNERPPLLVLDPLLAFLDAVGLGSGEPDVQPVGDGHSNVTYLVTRGDAEFVVRRPPRGPLPPSAHDVLREARVLRGLEGRARVPKVLAVCDDEAVIGSPFYVMEKVEGLVVTTEVPPALDSLEDRRRMGEELVDALVEVHGVDWREAGLEGFGKPTGYLERQLQRFLGLWEINRTRDIPAVETVGRWLADNMPGVRPRDDRPRRLPARQHDVRARTRRRGSSRSSTGRCRRSATRRPTSATSARCGPTATTRPRACSS